MTTPSIRAVGVGVGPGIASGWGRGDEGSRYDYRDGEHELTLIHRGAGRREARSLTAGAAEFALVVEGPLLLLCARFGEAIPWALAPYRPAGPVARAEARALPQPGAETASRALVTTTLIDPAGGPALARRGATVSLDFTRALHDAVRERALAPDDPAAIRRAWDRLRRSASTPMALAESAVVRSIGSP